YHLVMIGPYQLVKGRAGCVVSGTFLDRSYPSTVGSFGGYAVPVRAWVTNAARKGDRLELRADAETVSKFERSYKIVRAPFRLEPTGEKSRDTLVVHYAVVGGGDEVVAAGTSEVLDSGRLIVDLGWWVEPGAYRGRLAVAVNGHV